MKKKGHVECMGDNTSAYTILVGNPEGYTPLGGPKHRWGNIKWI
jgi:hypothetical protein